MTYNNFHYIDVLLDMLYGINMDEEDIEELGLLAWNSIGNKNTRLYKFRTCIQKDLSITLPCNAISGNSASEDNCVEAVTASYEDWKRSTNYSEHGDIRTSFIENSIELEKGYTSPYYIPGKLLKYQQIGDKLYFERNYGTVNVLYKGILTDENGLPQLTDKEAKAIATYIAYITKYKEGLSTNNANIMNLAVSLESKWYKQCDQARVTYLNQNDMNNILEVKSNWNRSGYGRSYKPIT